MVISSSVPRYYLEDDAFPTETNVKRSREKAAAPSRAHPQKKHFPRGQERRSSLVPNVKRDDEKIHSQQKQKGNYNGCSKWSQPVPKANARHLCTCMHADNQRNYDDDLWELQFYRWWSRNYLQRKEELSNQEYDRSADKKTENKWFKVKDLFRTLCQKKQCIQDVNCKCESDAVEMERFMDYVPFDDPRPATAYKSGKYDFGTSSTSTVGEKLPPFTQDVNITQGNGVCIKHGCPREHGRGECCSCDDEPCQCHCCFCECSSCDKTVQTYRLCTKECCTQTDKVVRKCCKCCRCCRKTKGFCRGCVNREITPVNNGNNVREENRDNLYSDEANNTHFETGSASYQDTKFDYNKTKMVCCKSTQCCTKTAEIFNSLPRPSLTSFVISPFDRKRDFSYKNYLPGEHAEEEGDKSLTVDESAQKNIKSFVSSTINFYNELKTMPNTVTVPVYNKVTDITSGITENVGRITAIEDTEITTQDLDRLKNIETKVMSKLEILEEKLNKVTDLKTSQLKRTIEKGADAIK